MRQSICCSIKTAYVTFSVVTVWFGVDHDGDDNDDDSGGDGVIVLVLMMMIVVVMVWLY